MTKLVEQYIEYLRFEKGYSSHTEISYSTDLRQFVSFVKEKGESLTVKDIDSDIVRSWIVSLMKEKRSPASVNRKLSAVKSFFNYLLLHDLIQENKVSRVKGPKEAEAIPSFVNAGDMNHLLDMIEDDGSFEVLRNKTIMELFYATGMRRAELIALRDQDIDFGRKIVRVLGKGNKERFIPLNTDIILILEEYKKRRNKEVDVLADSFFVKEDGNPIYPMLVHRIVTKYLGEIATLSKSSPHVIRHSFATAMLNGGADISAVKELLGHSSLAATEIYTHTSLGELKKIYNKAHPRA